MDDCRNERPAGAGAERIHFGTFLGMWREGGVFYRTMQYPGDARVTIERCAERHQGGNAWEFDGYGPSI
mgnify:CR=1 FL=1